MQTSAGTALTIPNASTNVGIGVTDPSTKLEVAGHIRPSGVGNGILFDTTGSESSNAIKTINDYETLIANGRGSAGFAVIGNQSIRLGFGTNYTTAETDLFINTSGNVGIGTTSPGTKLHISSGATDEVLRLEGTGSPYLSVYDSGTRQFFLQSAGDTLNFYAENDNTIAFFTSGTRALDIDSSQRVGIGTTSPTAKLEVVSSDGTETLRLHKSDVTITENELIGEMLFTTADTTLNSDRLVIGAIKCFAEENFSGANANEGSLQFFTANATDLRNSGSPTPRMVINENGFVGIGETSIDANLHISGSPVVIKMERVGQRAMRMGTPDNSSNFVFADADDLKSSQRMVIDNTGNIGIGTTSPTEKLEVNGNIRIGNGGGLFAEHSSASLGGTVIHPNGGTYRTNSNAFTGAIKITLPTGTGTIADMISFWVDVFDYNTNESFTCYIAGYAYQTAGSNEWVNEEALMLSANENRDFVVRFGHDGSNHCVYIGELTSGWNYPQITIRNVQIGYSSDVDTYNDGWSIGFESSAFQNVDHTQTDNFPYAKGLKSSSNMGAYIDGNEKFRFTTGGAFHASNDVVAFSTTPSDIKLKTNVKDLNYGLDTIMKLKPKQYDWKKDNRKDIGFIAQEVEEVIPEIVKDNEWFDDKIKTMDYEKLTAVLIKAVQEQQQQINELKEKLNG